MTSPTERSTQLAEALAALRQRVSAAAEAVGRDPAQIELLPVTKFFPASDVALLAAQGCRSFGEARDQEARAKIAELAGRLPAEVSWQMIGRLQRNKARSVAGWADAVHSVDGLRLADALDRAAAEALDAGDRGAPLRVYVQLSLDGDTARGGIDAGDTGAVDAVCDRVGAATTLRLAGLMAVPPRGADPDAAFARLAAVHRRVRDRHPEAVGLSAGMSGDLEVAVKHGSTCLRVGTALLGQRPLTSPSVVTPVTSSSHLPDSPAGSRNRSPGPPLFREGSSQ